MLQTLEHCFHGDRLWHLLSCRDKMGGFLVGGGGGRGWHSKIWTPTARDGAMSEFPDLNSISHQYSTPTAGKNNEPKWPHLRTERKLQSSSYTQKPLTYFDFQWRIQPRGFIPFRQLWHNVFIMRQIGFCGRRFAPSLGQSLETKAIMLQYVVLFN